MNNVCLLSLSRTRFYPKSGFLIRVSSRFEEAAGIQSSDRFVGTCGLQVNDDATEEIEDDATRIQLSYLINAFQF